MSPDLISRTPISSKTADLREKKENRAIRKGIKSLVGVKNLLYKAEPQSEADRKRNGKIARVDLFAILILLFFLLISKVSASCLLFLA